MVLVQGKTEVSVCSVQTWFVELVWIAFGIHRLDVFLQAYAWNFHIVVGWMVEEEVEAEYYTELSMGKLVELLVVGKIGEEREKPAVGVVAVVDFAWAVADIEVHDSVVAVVVATDTACAAERGRVRCRLDRGHAGH